MPNFNALMVRKGVGAMDVFDIRALDRKFKKLSSEDTLTLPTGLTESTVNLFTRILSATSLDEVADISNDELAALFPKIVPFSKMMNNANDFADGSVEVRLRNTAGQGARRRII